MADRCKPSVLGLIPARAGSRGVPGKNIMNVAGRPLIAYSIEHALRSEYINRVIVSTDGEQIAAVARDFGAEVPFLRPTEFAGDFSPDIDAFRHCIHFLQQEGADLPELIVHLRPTGPVRSVELIDKAIAMMLTSPEGTALRSVGLAQQTPYKMWLIQEGFLEPVARLENMPEAHSSARQLLPKAYWQNGYVDIVRPETILEYNSMVGPRPLAFVVEEPKYEIDYPEDVPIVERALYALRENPSVVVPEVEETNDRFPV